MTMTSITTTKSIRQLGRDFTKGVLDVLCAVIVAGLILSFILAHLAPTDSTDQDRLHRSGMSLYTDHATGLQYLGKGDSLTPRLDRDGRQMRAANSGRDGYYTIIP